MGFDPKFHTKYLHKDEAERRTDDKRRLKSFIFDEVELQYRRDTLFALLFSPSIAGPKVKSEEKAGIQKLRSYIKYYQRQAGNNQTVVCFGISVKKGAKSSRIHIKDFDYEGILPQDVDPSIGRSSIWNIYWK